MSCRASRRSGHLIAVFSLLVASAATAQPDRESSRAVSAAPEPVFIAPIYEGGVRKNRGISIPMNLRLRPERRLFLGYTASNSYLNPDLLVCADRSCELEYEADHTANVLFVNLTQPVLEHWEFGFGVATLSMNNIAGWSPVHQLVSDEALRAFHQDVLREDSLPELSHAPDGRQVFSMTDLAGRRLSLIPERYYRLPLRVDLTRYFELRETERSVMVLNLGMHLTHPIEGNPGSAPGQTALARGVDFGISVNLVRSLRITARVSSTWHVQLARFRSDVHVVNADSPFHGDDLMRSQYALTYGLRFAGTFAGRAPCSFSMSQISNTAHYDKQRYWTWDPLVFEGGNNLRGAILGANDYGALTFGCQYRGRALQVSLVEDIGGFSQFLTDDGAGTSYDPDFAVSVAASWALGGRTGTGTD